MAKFIAISGASTTGKSTLIDYLSTYPELRNCIFGPDIQDVVWTSLVSQGLFQEFTEISDDADYICVFIYKMIEYYNSYIDKMKDVDAIVFLDTCWLDLSIYAILNMWYTRGIKSVQEDILDKLSTYEDKISRIYITKADDESHPVEKHRLRGRMATFRKNRSLEIKYYELAAHFENTVRLPDSDITESALFILEDLEKLGYLS